ncbi:MAG: hypothetical protein SVX43_05070 [Cyanobacteriota bacterium]|nr:hypothetical protein [Cyanobacteriota bacterium]
MQHLFAKIAKLRCVPSAIAHLKKRSGIRGKSVERLREQNLVKKIADAKECIQ